MSYVKAAPELLEAASADLAGIGSTLSTTNAQAAAPTISVPPPGADGVSTALSALFGSHGQAYQQLSAQAKTYHDQFVQLLQAGARSYSTVDVANQASLQVESSLSAAGSAAAPAAAQAATSWAAGGQALTASLAPAAASVAPAPETPIYALLANSPAFEGLSDWLS